ncbi:MAG: TonB-dependent receptor [Maricaulaceae bacterium]
MIFPASRLRASLFAATALAASGGSTAFAQDAADPETVQTTQSTVERIVVTAQRREQNLQDVAVAVASYGAEQLQNSGVNDIKDLIQLAPSLNVTSTTSSAITSARVRGIGTVGDNPGLESSVQVLIDGVIRSRNGVGFGELGEVERIEFLRGPQGTLFGKNTSAGLIHVITKAPEDEFEVTGEYQVGNFGLQRGAVGVSAPLTDTLGFRGYFVRENRDGFLDVETGNGPRTSTENDDSNFWSFRGQFFWEPNEKFSARLIGDYTIRDEDCCLGVPTVTNSITPLVNALGGLDPTETPFSNPDQFTDFDPFDRVANANRDTEQEIRDTGVSLQLDYDLGFATLSSITGYRIFDFDQGQDVDFTSADIAFRSEDLNGFDFDTFTQEIRLAGDYNDFFWQVGFFYQNEQLERRDAIQLGGEFEEFIAGQLTAALGAPDFTFISDLTNAIGVGAFAPFGVGPIDGFVPFAAGAGLPGDGGNQGDVFNQSLNSFAFFGQTTWSVSDRTEVTAGLRFTREVKDATADFSEGVGPACDVFESLFGSALDFGLPENQLTLVNLATAVNASLGVPPGVPGPVTPTLAGTIAGSTCLPFVRDVFAEIGIDDSRTENEVTGHISLSHRLTDDILGYASYSRGYKAGGFNLDRFVTLADGVTPVNFTELLESGEGLDAQFDEETVDSFEVGLKTGWFNNQLLLNLTGFYQIFDDFQLNTFSGVSFFVTSIDEVITRGFELESLWNPPAIEGLSLTGNVSFNDAFFQEFPLTGVVEVDQLSGAQASLAPRWTLQGGATYEWPIPNFDDLVGRFHIDGRFVTEFNTGSDLDPQKVQDAFGTINLRLALGEANRRWSVELFAQNVTNADFFQVVFDAPLQAGPAPGPGDDAFNAFLGAPRTWGARLAARY